MCDGLDRPEENALAVQAKTDPLAFARLHGCCERTLKIIAVDLATKRGLRHWKDDAIQEARVALLSAVGDFDPNRGDFHPHARVRVDSRVRTSLTRIQKRNMEGYDGEDIAGPEPEPPSESQDAERARRYFDAIPDPEQRRKAVVWQTLTSKDSPSSRTKNASPSHQDVADALALSAAGLRPVTPEGRNVASVRHRWDYAAPILSATHVPGLPPPVPATWTECVDLFCAPTAAAPKPPNVARLRDEDTRADELRQWRQRTRRHFSPAGIEKRRR